MADDVAPADNPSGPGGQASSDTKPVGFDRDGYLGSLPEDERVAKAALPNHILEREAQRGMLRSTFDRNRGEDAKRVRSLEAEKNRLQGQLEAAMAIGRPAEAEAPKADDLAAKLYDASTPEEYASIQRELVKQGVTEAVQQALSSNPVMRQMQAGIALRDMRSSSEPDDQADYDVAVRTAQADLAEDGADITMLEPAALKAYLKPHLRAARAERLLQASGKADKPPKPPATPKGGTGTLPVRGLGVGGGRPPSAARPVDGAPLSVDDKVARALGRAGLTQEQADDARRRF